MKIWSIIPILRFEQGHNYIYNISVAGACDCNAWHHAAFVPRNCEISNLPENWMKNLYEDNSRDKGCKLVNQTRKQRYVSILKSITPIYRSLKIIKKDHEQKKIILLESFTLENLLPFVISLLFVNPKAKIWILHRYSVEGMGFVAKVLKVSKVYKLLHSLIELRYGKKQLTLLTDSELLAENLSSYFKRSFFVMPIPHTQFCLNESILINKKRKKLWWPGGYTTPAKGLNVIKQLSKYKNDNFCLVMADSAKEYITDAHLPMEFIPAHLSRDEYMEWMQKSDLILLPYRPDIYKYGTSGIFVESIMASKIPIVSGGTWMAYELKKYGLNKLVVDDWNNSLIFEFFEEVLNSDYIRVNLNNMKNYYREFHSIKGYASEMLKILELEKT